MLDFRDIDPRDLRVPPSRWREVTLSDLAIGPVFSRGDGHMGERSGLMSAPSAQPSVTVFFDEARSGTESAEPSLSLNVTGSPSWYMRGGPQTA